MNDCLNCLYSGRPSYKSPCSECRNNKCFEARPKPMVDGDFPGGKYEFKVFMDEEHGFVEVSWEHQGELFGVSASIRDGMDIYELAKWLLRNARAAEDRLRSGMYVG